MSGADIANLIIIAVYLPVQALASWSATHYIRTGRWFG